VYLTIELPDAKDVKLNLKPEGHFNFSAKGVDDLPYELDLELFDAMNVEVGVLIWAEFGSWMCNHT
jgi:cytosolic prostaglandin-E synthase